MSIKLGLTGSIGMGKSTTSGFFRDFGVPVWDADAEVHRMYMENPETISAIAGIAPAAVKKGFVNRAELKSEITKDRGLLPRIEAAIAPALRQSRAAFQMANRSAPLVLFDIPLLFETKADSWLDYVLVVTAPAEVQLARVLARDTMDEAMLNTILSRQLPDSEKRRRADFVFDTSYGMEQTKSDVKALIEALEAENA